MKHFQRIAIIGLMMLACVALAGPTEDVSASAAYKRGDSTDVLKIIRPLGEQGIHAMGTNVSSSKVARWTLVFA